MICKEIEKYLGFNIFYVALVMRTAQEKSIFSFFV